jgi:hypothetical protein
MIDTNTAGVLPENIQKINNYESEGKVKTRISPCGRYIVVCYAQEVFWKKTEWDSFLLNSARGHVYRLSDGECVCNPFPKFFNFNEVEENKPALLEAYEKRVKQERNTHPVVYEKIDGSLLSINNVDGEWLYTTKCSFTNIYIDKAREYLPPEKLDLAAAEGYTYCFEIRISEDPMMRCTDKENGLYLLGIRSAAEGDIFYTPEMLEYFAELLEVKHPRSFDYSISFLCKESQKLSNTEGFVAVFPKSTQPPLQTFEYSSKDCYRLKFKTTWYLALNRFLDSYNTPEKRKEFVLDNILFYDSIEGTEGDSFWIKLLPEEVQDATAELALYLRQELESKERFVEWFYRTHGGEGFGQNRELRRIYAREALKSQSVVEPGVLFARLDGKDWKRVLVESLKKE